MILRIDPVSHVPPYEQIRTQIETMAANHVLSKGDRLPSIRQLASDLGLARGTVARAYRELEQTGVIVTRGRHGTFVEEATSITLEAGSLDEVARDFAVKAIQLGAKPDSAIAAVRGALKSARSGL